MVIAALLFFQSNGFEFNPRPDTFSPSAVLDMRSLNEKEAGEHGYISVDKNGDFVRGDGEPIRFWAMDTVVGREKPWHARPRWTQQEPDLKTHANFMAKRGINLVRFHAQIAPTDKQRIDDVNQSEIDWVWRGVAAMKKAGVYSVVSPYWMVPTKIPESWGVPGGAQGADGLLFFDPTMRNAYKIWLRKLLEPKNPYTGISLAKDPAMAIFEIQNEDSLLFWTFNNIKGRQRDNLIRLFNQFLMKKYGNDAAIRRAWQGASQPADATGHYDLMNIWEMTQHRTGGVEARLADQLEFMSKTMYDFNADIEKYLRDTLGCKALVNAGNWRTADTVRLNDAERWSYTANEVDAVNRYTGGIHKGPNEGWSVDRGDKYASTSILDDPKEFPLNIKQTVGRPMVVTESMWVMPCRNMVEAPFLVSAYSSLNGVDAYCWFATGDEQWTPPQSANGYNEGQMKWFFGSPDVLGAFPATAYMYRKGLIQRGKPAVIENRQLQDIWNRNVPIISEESGYDPNRDSGDIAPSSNIKTGVDPMAYFIGPVQVNYGGKGESYASTKGWDKANKTVTSNTGELTFDYGKGVCKLDAPMAQGFVAKGPGAIRVQTSSMTAVMQSSFGSLVVVSLDNQPIATSKKVLVQFNTEARPSGWKERPTTIKLDGGKEVPGFEITDIGHAPWVCEKANLVLAIKNKNLVKGSVLDSNLVPSGKLDVTPSSDGIRIGFPENALYVLLEAN
ncbi:MAG: hypothetical protein GC165_08280 [Armatimonadetes bacterium]|nr:hypothetical protein [Armatimonadota bacterium]